MKMYLKQSLTLVICAMLPVTSIFATSYYIALDGNDSWSGLLAEPNADKTDGPVATLDAARLRVRQAIRQGLKSPVEVLIRDGKYELSETVVFGVEDSGTESCPVTYKAYPGETPVFTGGKRLTDWQRCKNDPEHVADAAQGKLWSCDIPRERVGQWQITTLYDGMTMLPRSRSPEFKASKSQVEDLFNQEPKSIKGGPLNPDGSLPVYRRDLSYEGDDIKDWPNPQDIEIVISPKHTWLMNILPINRIDAANKTAYFAIDPTYSVVPKNSYFVENALDYLDEPGEWAFDSRLGRVYLWPEGDLSKTDIRAPYLQEFIRVEGIEGKQPVRFLQFSGLTFRHGLRETLQESDMGLQHDWDMYNKSNAAFRFCHAENCLLTDCIFEASSGGGVRLDLYCQHITVANSRFAGLGGTGILLSGYAPGLTDVNKFNTITNNYIHDIGTLYLHAPGIFIAQSGHNLISHNTIHDLNYNGMVISGCRPADMLLAKVSMRRREWVTSLSWEEIEPYMKGVAGRKADMDKLEPLLHARENLITDNDIYKVMKTLGNGNNIYFSGMGSNNRLERNYIHDTEGTRGLIRLDDNTAPVLISHNVFHRGDRLMTLKAEAEYDNNFAIDMGGADIGRARVTRCLILQTESGAKKKPKFNADALFGKSLGLANSIFYDANLLSILSEGDDIGAGNKSEGETVGVLFADPMLDLEAMKQKIFRFKPGSPAEKLGIQPIDLSNVGSSLAN